ncbi:MAG: head GIN domain-containing protein [Pyrinomonadaceae bacterium]
MKNFRLLLTVMLVVITPLITGCVFHHGEVIGSGQRQKQIREIAAFTSISTEGAYEIDFEAQKPLSLEIEADDNILPIITTDVSNGVLRIRSKTGFSVNQPIKLRITAPNLEGLSASGAGKIEVSGLQNEKFELDSSGAPTIKISGQTKALEINANGAGKIDAHKLRSLKADVESNGVAKVEVFASEELKATVSGPSQVIYSGDPKVTKSVNGPGSVEKKASEGS